MSARAVCGLQVELHFRRHDRVQTTGVKRRQQPLQHHARLQRAACAVRALHGEQQLGVMLRIVRARAQRAADRQAEPVRLALRHGARNHLSFVIHFIDGLREIAALRQRAQALHADAFTATAAVEIVQVNIDVAGVRVVAQIRLGLLAKRYADAVRRARQHPGIQQSRKHNRFLRGRNAAGGDARAAGFEPGSKSKGKHRLRFFRAARAMVKG